MSILGIILIIVAALVAWKVTIFFVRVLLFGVILVGLYLVIGPLIGAG